MFLFGCHIGGSERILTRHADTSYGLASSAIGCPIARVHYCRSIVLGLKCPSGAYTQPLTFLHPCESPSCTLASSAALSNLNLLRIRHPADPLPDIDVRVHGSEGGVLWRLSALRPLYHFSHPERLTSFPLVPGSALLPCSSSRFACLSSSVSEGMPVRTLTPSSVCLRVWKWVSARSLFGIHSARSLSSTHSRRPR